jgi:hypothetical protein
MIITKTIFALIFASAAFSVCAQTLASFFGDAKPNSANLELDVKGHGRGSAYLNVKEFGGSKASGVFNSGAFADKPVSFTATVEGSKFLIKTDHGNTIEASLKKQADGSYMGEFSGDFSGTVKLTLK